MIKTQPSRQLLTVTDVSDRLALKPATIRKMIFQRRISVVRIGRSVRIPIEEVEQLIQAGFQQATNSIIRNELGKG